MGVLGGCVASEEGVSEGHHEEARSFQAERQPAKLDTWRGHECEKEYDGCAQDGCSEVGTYVRRGM